MLDFIFNHPILTLVIIAFVVFLAVGFYKDWKDPV